MRKIIIIAFIAISSLAMIAAFNEFSTLPKYEFRGGWIATVINLDWPSSPHASTQNQKTDLLNQLDEMKNAGINAVIFQIRSESDAMYDSNYDPWSYWLTGSQGTAPSPYYDPLEFAIEEAHKRGMELHAWFNPYRVSRDVSGTYPVHSTHVSVRYPSWVIQIGNIKVLDPGLPMVRDYVVDVIMDVVHRYDVDGIHFDDYFYPYPPDNITNQDYGTFAQYPRGFTDIHNWRRNNVNIFVEQIQDSINLVKPYIKWGISPFGIWKNGVPPGIIGLNAFGTIYCDALAWLTAQTVDYIAPQCYWAINAPGQWYDVLVPWWANQINSQHLYIGQIINSSYSNSELPNQIQINRQTPNVSGNIIFRSKLLINNSKGFKDSLMNNYFKYHAITPSMSWKDSIPPNEPGNLRYDILPNDGVAAVQWDIPLMASDGDTASRYAIYRFNYIPIDPSDLSDPENILSIEGMKNLSPDEPNDTGPYYYVVTSLDRNSNESLMSNVLMVNSPSLTQLIYPQNGAINIPDSIYMQWENCGLVSKFHLQVSTDSLFVNNIIVDINDIPDTTYLLTGINGEENYYWRVKAKNAGGSGSFSNIFSFETGFPRAPLLAYPEHNATNLSLEPILSWYSVQNANSYRLQVARSSDYNIQSIVYDSTGIIDTSATMGPLQTNKRHYWRVKAINALGVSVWSESRRFKTIDPSSISDSDNLPLDYFLGQNYPNPFNQTTTIEFAIKEAGHTIIIVYNILGKVAATIFNSKITPGKYKVIFDSKDLASGLYIYRLITENKKIDKKLLILK